MAQDPPPWSSEHKLNQFIDLVQKMAEEDPELVAGAYQELLTP